MSPIVPVINAENIKFYLQQIDIIDVMDNTFNALATGMVVQPPQSLTLFPQNGGDFITYLGVLAHKHVFGAKLSPYIPTGGAPIITAWTLLMSMQTGQPLMLCDAGLLTQQRTAATTALAVDKLAAKNSQKLAIIGSGAIALAHLALVLPLREWQQISLFSPNLAGDSRKQQQFKQLDPRIAISDSAKTCIAGSDVVMLCTSSATPVISVADIGKPALITSISTNAVNAHEIEPEQLLAMDVYCDYKSTTPESAGEMVLAAKHHQWSKEAIIGDLADLSSGQCVKPTYDKAVFFRSIGLGLEDVAIAQAIYQQIQNH